MLSKGYCFVEYVDPHVTATAIQGLNGMDIGGGKTLTARLAGERGGDMGLAAGAVAPAAYGTSGVAPAPGQPPANRTIVHGYDIEALVDAAMGQTPMPTAPVYTDAMGVPLTRIIPLALQVATAAAEAVSAATGVTNGGLAPPAVPSPSRVLVLHNMVQPDDLATSEDHAALKQEVEEECAKFGTLKDVVIPRQAEGGMDPSAVGKIYLRYSTVEEANKAKQELQGRQFGDAVVQVTTLSESDFDGGRLR